MIGKMAGMALVLLLCLSLQTVAQKRPVPNPVFTADSLATGNFKDVLSSFFQLAFDQLTSPDKEIRFTGSPFAVMAKLDTTLLVDTSYVKYRALRNLNYMFSLALDTAYKFNGFSSGIKYALINKRDETVSRAFMNMVHNNDRVKQLYALNDLILAKISTMGANTPMAITEYRQFTAGAKNFSALSQSLQDTIMVVVQRNDNTKMLGAALLQNGDFNLAQTADSIYQDLKANFNQNLLWTVGITDTTYKDQFAFSNIVFHTELLKGLNQYKKAKNDLELNIRSQLQMTDDSLRSGRNLKRALFNFEPAVNLALKTRTTKKSYFEFKFGGAWYHNFSTLYAGETRDRLIMHAVIRIRVLNDIWVPFEIKYDPKNGNFLGFINVRANFKALAGAAKQL